MATTKSTVRKLTRPYGERPKGFTVTVEREVGFVAFGGEGEDNPTVVAFRIIAHHEADHPEGGVYRFPTPNASTAVIAVSYEEGNC